jgi:DNA-binding HxlR family transcriptional regulator
LTSKNEVPSIYSEVTRYRQFCVLARAAELVGERWTLLIVRELLLGPRRFADLARGLTGISSSLLTQRLARMEAAGVIARSMLPPPASMPVYELSPLGQALRPAVRELARWGARFIWPPRPGDVFQPEWLPLALDVLLRKGPTPARTFNVRVVQGRRHAEVCVCGGRRGTEVRAVAGAADLSITAPAEALFALASGALSGEDAARARHVELAGDLDALVDLPRFFDLPPQEGQHPGREHSDRAKARRAARRSSSAGRPRRRRRRLDQRP